MTNTRHAITGAFGYTGKHIAQRLLERGVEVITLTNSPQRANPFGDRVKAFPFHFDEPQKLAESLQGVSVLYNTYWVRFNYSDSKISFGHQTAIRNILALFQAAKQAGVKRIVHVSIANPSEDSPLEYYRGKALCEKALRESGLSYAILRPTVIFGKEDVLINNIAWFLRTFPIFGVFGDGQYELQPIYVEDFVELAINQGLQNTNNIIDAIGPETFTYRELVGIIGKEIGSPRPIISIPDFLGYWLSIVVGRFVGDIPITREEIEGLKANLLVTKSPPAGKTKLTDWLKTHAATLGKHYTSEIARRKNRQDSYETLEKL